MENFGISREWEEGREPHSVDTFAVWGQSVYAVQGVKFLRLWVGPKVVALGGDIHRGRGRRDIQGRSPGGDIHRGSQGGDVRGRGPGGDFRRGSRGRDFWERSQGGGSNRRRAALKSGSRIHFTSRGESRHVGTLVDT